MSVIKIELAERAGARLVIGLAGISGSGKTRTALEIAYGLANYNARKIGFLDTENGRGRLYADVLKNEAEEVQRFYYGGLDAPFSPDRFIDAILEFQKMGVEVLVIDTTTHEWEGQGGCHDIAAAAGRNGTKNWLVGKERHKRFMNIMLQSDMHIIACIRAREKVEVVDEVVDGKRKTVFKPLGIMPIQEENFMFEMTASLMMWDEGKMQRVMKCPGELRGMLGREKGYISPADGKALRDWVDGGTKLDPEVEHAKNSLRTTTEQGMAALQKAWEGLPAKLRKKIGGAAGCPEEFKKAAQEFDAQRALKKPGGEALDQLNREVIGGEAPN
jgi:hypothetical protein